MSSVNNINNNNYVVNVGRTTPVDPGPQPASKSIPVVVSTDQEAVPVVEQNKILSEVSLSLLGIPRAEVALGIFADVNTYDVNPSEWSSAPEQRLSVEPTERNSYTNIPGKQTTGISHLPEESGALVEAGADETAVLTSKRFFRYQPGRVSAATFGIKSSTATGALSTTRSAVRNPTIKKYGIFDKFDGYYWETRDTAQGDQFAVVRRTQSIIRSNPLEFGNGQLDDYALAGKPPASTPTLSISFTAASKSLTKGRFTIVENAITNPSPGKTYYDTLDTTNKAKCERDMDLAIDAYVNDLRYGGDGYTSVNATTYRTADGNNGVGEAALHDALTAEIKAYLDNINETVASAKTDTLGAITSTAAGGVQPTIANINWPAQQNKLQVIKSVYRKYLGYLVSVSQTYDTSITDETTLKYKCLRDVKFAVDAYFDDLVGEGNAATIYNAKRYYFKDGATETTANGLQVYTQTDSGVISEIARHTYLKKLLVGDPAAGVADGSQVAIEVAGVVTATVIDCVLDLFSITNQKNSLSTLTDITIGNFTTPYQGGINFGSNPVFGDAFILRDGLLMTHAALYDPSLLKETKRQIVKAVGGKLVCETGDLIIGQYVTYFGDGNLVDGKTYKISAIDGHKSHIISLVDPVDDSAVSLTSGTTHSIETPVPFIFPKDGDIPGARGYEETFDNAENKYDGMFPYKYSDSGILPAEPLVGANVNQVGYVDTAIDTTANASTLQIEIDRLNLAFVGWIRDHVDPQYWSVYEYRVPRSRFSGDSLDGPFEEDGETPKTRKAVYSDNVSGNRAGEAYIVNDEQVLETSVWDYDFSKVTMLKIEFSWYGAVGALFLAYVPVGNGEARWVRVHHLRCSNQLKISSLGNATLPITYLVYGGGSENRFGVSNTSRANSGYNSSYSENLVKYGASYYIDGGDRGTVRLYNHSLVDPAKGDLDGGRFAMTVDGGVSTQDTVNPYFVVTGVGTSPALSTFYIGASIITGNPADQDIEVIWVDTVNNYIYTNKVTAGQPSSIELVVDRPKLLYGLKTKANILSGDGDEVRNRVQVYPTKLSTGTTGSGSGKLTLLKTPLFQTTTVTSGTFTLTADMNLGNTNLLTTADSNFIPNDGDFTYGYFKGYINDSSSFVKLLGKLERKNDLYYFYPYDVFSGKLELKSGSEFVQEIFFDSTGTPVDYNVNDFSKERLSSVLVSNVVQSPIPGTGTDVATYYVNAGSQDYDLSAYFDYNKEYISFPLTDSIETLYLSLKSQAAYTGSTLLNVSASITWEEQ